MWFLSSSPYFNGMKRPVWNRKAWQRLPMQFVLPLKTTVQNALAQTYAFSSVEPVTRMEINIMNMTETMKKLAQTAKAMLLG